MQVLDAAVRWNLTWANDPQVHFLVDEDWREPFNRPAVEVWHPFVERLGTFYITRHAPAVRFLFEDPRPSGDIGRGDAQRHGALGRSVTLPDGTEYKTYGGWSSNAARINQLRAHRDDVRDLLPEEIVEAACYEGRWDATGFAGVAFDLGFVREQLDRFCAGVTLYASEAPADDQASSEQSTFIHAGLPVREDELGSAWTPWPDGQPRRKPEEGSELYQRTSAELRYTNARAAARA